MAPLEPIAAINGDQLSGGIARGRRGQKECHFCNLFGAAKALHGKILFDLCYPLIIKNALLSQAQEYAGFNYADRNTVGPNIMRAFFFSDAFNELLNGSFWSH